MIGIIPIIIAVAFFIVLIIILILTMFIPFTINYYYKICKKGKKLDWDKLFNIFIGRE